TFQSLPRTSFQPRPRTRKVDRTLNINLESRRPERRYLAWPMPARSDSPMNCGGRSTLVQQRADRRWIGSTFLSSEDSHQILLLTFQRWMTSAESIRKIAIK